MCAIANGLALHGGFIPYVGTFLTFSDYARNALRMAALIRLRAVFVFTHDSIGLGEDGPTHQAVEHTASLRLIPHLDVWRPGDTRRDRGRRGSRRSSAMTARPRSFSPGRTSRSRRATRVRSRISAAAATCSPTSREPRRAPRRADRHRIRACARRGGARRARGERHRCASRLAALHQRVRAAGERYRARRAARGRAAAWRSKPA